MCGIAGLLDHRSTLDLEVRTTVVERLCQLQQHRGPDASGIWVAPNKHCVLGHRRLAVIDLDVRSNQPMISASGRYAVTFNGEIYNFQALKTQLTGLGVEFHTASDTEVLLAGFAHWGLGLFPRLDGMFALGIYDAQTDELVLARDRLGEKPLYVARVGSVVAFASEFKPLLTLPGLARDVSAASLFEFFALRYVADPHTLYEAISSVQPGTLRIIKPNGEESEQSYFAFDVVAEKALINEHDYLDALESELTQAIQTRLIADVPVGAFLSSGVDSSLICSIAAKGLGRELRCFSAGFVGGEENETVVARKIAENLGLPFEAYLVSHGDLLESVGDFGKVLDEPNGDRSCVPMYFLASLIRKNVTVAISGDGGDELFGGYGRYAAFRSKLNPRRSNLDSVMSYFSTGLPVFPLDALRTALPEQESIFHERFAARFITAFARQELDDIERLRLIDLHSYLPGAVLAKVDRMSMRHALEVRTPFFSPAILRLSERLPMSLCSEGGLLKVALRKLLARHLPPNLIRSDKQGFGMPASFFRAHADVFSRLASSADEALAEWAPFRDRPKSLATLRAASRHNINSYWAWIMLGQWSTSLPTD